MSDDERLGQEGAPGGEKETVERLRAEVERLRGRLASEKYAEELREALITAATVGTIATPVAHSRLLEMIVEAAAHVISARAGSLFLINRETQELIFEVALGQKAEEVKKFAVPLGHGIAGLVAVSGQPMAVSDAQHDPRQAADIAKSIGYTPNSILCVPLFYNEEIIGVLELLDKATAPSFSASDMETLGLFGNQAAVAIELSRTHRNLAALMGDVLNSLVGVGEGEKSHLQKGAASFVGELEETMVYRQALDLARLVREIVWQGENEAEACTAILRGFAGYLRSRPKLLELGGPL
ncbi:MAG: GAF domain-containing protein [Chloroflexia bacterium]